MKKLKQSRDEFIKEKYITCPKCAYNNKKSRFLQYGKCLRCGEILDQKTYFMIQMMKRINKNRRKKG